MLKNTTNSSKPIDLPPMNTMSSADSKKLRELCEKVPELDKIIKLMLERIEKSEDKLDAHDFTVKEISKTLPKKADKTELNDITGLESTVKDILRQLKQFDIVKENIDMLTRRSEGIEKTTVIIEGRIDYINNTINGRLRDLENILVALKEELEKLDKESNRQGGSIILITQRIDTLEIKVDNFDKMLSGGFLGNSIGNTANNYDISELKKAMGVLKRDFLTFKEEYYKRDKDVETELEKKVDKADLVEYERVMRERLDNLEKSLQKAKSDLKKAMRILDERVKRMSDKVPSRGPSLDKDEAMIARKPLEGWK